MNPLPSQPLATFLLLAYRQERFIREAIQGAFAQTYSPLEIILSDDCSPDRTFEIMEEMASAYGGPHVVVLNRNPVNVGLAEHVNRALCLARGEWVVVAAGDDISEPIRTERLMAGVGPGDCSIYSNLVRVDEHGSVEGLHFTGPPTHAVRLIDAVRQRGVFLVGASHAIRRSAHLQFDPLPPGVVQEDEVLSFRSLLAGTIAYVDEPLVRYRRHDTNLWHNTRYTWRNFREQRRREATALRAKFLAWLRDLERAHELGLPSCAGPVFVRLTQDLRAHIEGEIETRIDLANSPWWRCPAAFLRSVRRLGVKGALQQFLMAVLPHRLHLAALGFCSRMRRLARSSRP